MNQLTKTIGALTALIASITGLLVALRGGEAAPQPVSTIVIISNNDIDEYQEFVDQTDLPQYEHLKGSS